jgi:hypothetical protein
VGAYGYYNNYRLLLRQLRPMDLPLSGSISVLIWLLLFTFASRGGHERFVADPCDGY